MSTDPVAQLAAQLATATTAATPQPTVVQGVIVSWQNTATPPTVTITLSGDTTQIPGIQYVTQYTPVVGDVVQIIKQNGSLLVMGTLTAGAASGQGWNTTSISGISYRLNTDNGTQYVEFMGNGTATGSTLFTLPAGFRPSGTRETVLVLASVGLVILTIATSGACTIAVPPGGSGSTSSDGTGSSTGHSHSVNAVHSHTHGGAVAESDFVPVESDDQSNDHSHTHSHTVSISPSLAFPNTIYIDSVRFYL